MSSIWYLIVFGVSLITGKYEIQMTIFLNFSEQGKFHQNNNTFK